MMKQTVLMRPRLRLVLPVVLVVSFLLPDVVSAHVSVLPAVVPVATTQVFTVRVPTERDVPTTSVRIEFPVGLIVSRFEPMPGWTRAVDKDDAGRIVAATWSGGAIAAEEYQDFVFLGRTPREPGTLTFKAYQTYEGGETVGWIEAADQNHPAPTIEVVAASSAPVEATETHMEAATAPVADTAFALAPTVAAPPTVPVANAPVATTGAAPSFSPVAGAAGDAAGSDLSLFVALGALVIAVIAVVIAAIAVARRPVAP